MCVGLAVVLGSVSALDQKQNFHPIATAAGFLLQRKMSWLSRQGAGAGRGRRCCELAAEGLKGGRSQANAKGCSNFFQNPFGAQLALRTGAKPLFWSLLRKLLRRPLRNWLWNLPKLASDPAPELASEPAPELAPEAAPVAVPESIFTIWQKTLSFALRKTAALFHDPLPHCVLTRSRFPTRRPNK